MNLDWMFTLELLVVVVLLVGFASGAIYLWVTGGGKGKGAANREDALGKRPGLSTEAPSREVFKRLSLETGEEMRARLYSIAEYESQLGGEPIALESGNLVTALKAYRCLDDEWYDYSPQRRRTYWNWHRKTMRWTRSTRGCCSRGFLLESRRQPGTGSKSNFAMWLMFYI